MKTINELEEIRRKTLLEVYPKQNEDRVRILVGMGTCGIAAGANSIYKSLQEEIEKNKLTNINLVKTGCIGVCFLEPIIELLMLGQEKITYIKMTPEKAIRVIEEHVIANKIVAEFTIKSAAAIDIKQASN